MFLAGNSKAAVYTVINTNASGPGSLQQAILDATSGSDTILFAIPAPGPYTIVPPVSLPAVSDNVTIDGTSQPGFSGKPIIELRGSSAGPGAVGLRLGAGGCTIRGLAINRFAGGAIFITSSGNRIQGNFLGTDTNGTVSLPNEDPAIWIQLGGANVIGGTTASDRNLISGNVGRAVFIQGSSSNVVRGNFIGTTFTGNGRLPNTQEGINVYLSPGNVIASNVISGNDRNGILIDGGGSVGCRVEGNIIGLDAAGSLQLSNAMNGVALRDSPSNIISDNVISGNSEHGIFISSPFAAGNIVQGNRIGTDSTGMLARSNGLAGIALSGAPGNLIGGSSAAARNVISGNGQDGLFLTNSTGNRIEGNFIGLASNGSTALGNGFTGISLKASGTNYIGGSAPVAGNVISANGYHGVWITNSASSGNVVAGNLIGTDATGMVARPNAVSGVRIEAAANTIGGTSASARNVISGNSFNGIHLTTTLAFGNSIQGNYIGTDITGTNKLANAGVGVQLNDTASGNLIGGAVAGAGNVISGNGGPSMSGNGISLIGGGVVGNTVQGNFIGTDSTGTRALGNYNSGIYLSQSTSNLIGGSTSYARNLISANDEWGIFMTNGAAWNIIQGNFIGTAVDGINNLGNGLGNGATPIECHIATHDNLIGGTMIGAGNRIAWSPFWGGFNRAGVRIRDGSTNNAVLGNNIFSNSGLGIDLSAFGVTVNPDPCVVQNGANMLQDFPRLTTAYSGVNTGIRGSLSSVPNRTYRLEFFANPACKSVVLDGNGQGHGEGQFYLGAVTIGPSVACSNAFTASLPVSVPIGYVVTATATDPAMNTSEFSVCVPVLPVPWLSLTTTGASQVNLAWTNTATDFVLLQTTNLSPPVLWSAVTNNPVVLNGQFVVSLAVTNGNRFYALGLK